MRALARRAGVTDGAELEEWGVVGMLHDFDYERFPTAEDHVWRGWRSCASGAGRSAIVRGVGAHANYTGIPRGRRWSTRSSPRTSSPGSSARARSCGRRRASATCRPIGGEEDEGQGVRAVRGPRDIKRGAEAVGDAARGPRGARHRRAGADRGPARDRRRRRAGSAGRAGPAGAAAAREPVRLSGAASTVPTSPRAAASAPEERLGRARRAARRGSGLGRRPCGVGGPATARRRDALARGRVAPRLDRALQLGLERLASRAAPRRARCPRA